MIGRSKRVLSLTMSELGFVLLFVVGALALIQQRQIEGLRNQVRDLAQENYSLRQANRGLRERVDSLERLSDVLDQCPGSPLFATRVLGSNRFEIEGVSMDAGQIIDRYRSVEEDSRRTLQCSNTVVAIPTDGLSTAEWIAAVRSLLQLVYYVDQRVPDGS